MPINIPSSTTTTLGTIEIFEDSATTHYQQFVLTSPSGVALGTDELPIPVEIKMSGTFTQAFNNGSTLFPSAGAYYNEPVDNSGPELQTGELSVLRTTAKGGLKTAGDGRVNELISTIADGYDDIYVVEDTFDPLTMDVIDPYGDFFDTSRNNIRYMYIPMIRSGWRKLSFSFKSATAGVMSVYADLGSRTADLQIMSTAIFPNVRYGFVPEAITATGILSSIPMLASSVNAFIICFSPSVTAAGTFEVHLVRGT
jgi:hypothetical protein